MMQQVIERFFDLQRAQHRPCGDALLQRFQAQLPQRLGDLRLRDQDKLHRFAAACFEIGQQPQFFEQVGVQMMRFVDDD